MLNIAAINVPKAADVLANMLREKILNGELSEGIVLPNERDMAEETGLSRASVREALRILQGEGIVAKRLGRSGGSVIVRPTSAAIERSVAMFIRGQGIRLAAVFETRSVIEPPTAGFAAIHRTVADIDELEFHHDRLERASASDDLSSYVRANLDWHVQVVRASHNELMIAFISAIARPVFVATDLEGFNSLSVRNAVIFSHRRVMDGIIAGDKEASERRMARHLGAYINRVKNLKNA